jgi:hypothetical protein
MLSHFWRFIKNTAVVFEQAWLFGVSSDFPTTSSSHNHPSTFQQYHRPDHFRPFGAQALQSISEFKQ